MNSTPRLMRSRTDTMLAGVAGGLARYLGVDPVLVRLAFVLLVFSGAGPLVYLVLALVMPLEPEASASSSGPTVVSEGAETQRLRGDPAAGQAADAEHEIPINNVGQPRAGGAVSVDGGPLLGWALLGIGGFLVLQMIWPGAGSLVFPALLVAAGVYLLRRR